MFVNKNKEDIVILLEGIKAILAKNDKTSQLTKEQIDFYGKICAEYSNESDDTENIIIDNIEQSVNNYHKKGLIKEVEISQISNYCFKFDHLQIELALEENTVIVKPQNVKFDDWLLKNFSIPQPTKVKVATNKNTYGTTKAAGKKK